MKCPYCNSEDFKSGAVRCPDCGKRLTFCGNDHISPGFSKFCPVCGDFIKIPVSPPRDISPVIIDNMPNSEKFLFHGDMFFWKSDDSTLIIPCKNGVSLTKIQISGNPDGFVNKFGDFKFGMISSSVSKFTELAPGILSGSEPVVVEESIGATKPIFLNKYREWFTLYWYYAESGVVPALAEYPSTSIPSKLDRETHIISISDDALIFMGENRYYFLSPDKVLKGFSGDSIEILGFIGKGSNFIAGRRKDLKMVKIWDITSDTIKEVEKYHDVLDVQMLFDGRMAILKRNGELIIVDDTLVKKTNAHTTIGSLGGAWYNTLVSFTGKIPNDSIQVSTPDGSIIGSWQLDFKSPPKVLSDRFGFAIELKRNKWALL